MTERESTRREFLKRAGAIAWVAPAIAVVQATPAMAGVETSVTSTTTSTSKVPED